MPPNPATESLVCDRCQGSEFYPATDEAPDDLVCAGCGHWCCHPGGVNSYTRVTARRNEKSARGERVDAP